MPRLPTGLASDLRTLLDLRRAIETGTYLGDGTRALAELFPSVVTIELSSELHRRAVESLADLAGVTVLLGDSRKELVPLAAEGLPTLYWLDGHWSGGITAGRELECPVLDEIRALRRGHPDDCILIDDARLFASAPPPPHDASKWPSLPEVLAALRQARPENHVTAVDDVIVSVPTRAQSLLAEFCRSAA